MHSQNALTRQSSGGSRTVVRVPRLYSQSALTRHSSGGSRTGTLHGAEVARLYSQNALTRQSSGGSRTVIRVPRLHLQNALTRQSSEGSRTGTLHQAQLLHSDGSGRRSGSCRAFACRCGSSKKELPLQLPRACLSLQRHRGRPLKQNNASNQMGVISGSSNNKQFLRKLSQRISLEIPIVLKTIFKNCQKLNFAKCSKAAPEIVAPELLAFSRN